MSALVRWDLTNASSHRSLRLMYPPHLRAPAGPRPTRATKQDRLHGLPWTVLAACLLLLTRLNGFAQPFVISEFMAANASSLRDEDGDFSDWIEIYNLNSQPASLQGWYLTDSAGNLAQWQFPAI